MADEFEIVRKQMLSLRGHTFYIEDDMGCLRRWNPPRDTTVFDKDDADDI